MLARPKVYVLTDGSGSTGTARLERSAQVLSRLGAEPSAVFGSFSDSEIYKAIIAGEVSRFTSVVDEVAKGWIRDKIELVASDANEGYSPTHDLCCEMAQAAAELVQAQTGRRIQRFTFCLTEWEGPKTTDIPPDTLGIRLSDEMLDEKIAVSRSYVELRSEVDRALALKGPDYFRNEYLLPTCGWACKRSDRKPTYEVYGEKQVSRGKYASVLRYGQHVLPIFKALREHVRSINTRGVASTGAV